MNSNYWFAYSARKERWLITDLGRWSYPVSWKGSLFLFVTIMAPIFLLLAAVPVILNLPEWQLALVVLVLAGAPIVAAILVMRAKTDPVVTIEDYRARKAGIKGDTSGPG